MKKIIALLLALVMCLALCACGGANKSATVLVNGQEEQMTAQDIMDKYDENPAAYMENYKGAKITFIGTIEQIKLDTRYCVEGSAVTSNGGNVIIFKEGFRLVLSQRNTKYDMADFNVGDKLMVTSGLGPCPEFNTEFMRECFGETRCVWVVGNDKFGTYGTFERFLEQYNDITTVIEKVE